MSDNSLIGQILGGRYHIAQLIGRGGMSSVYRAFDPNLQRIVAVKTIHSELAGDPKFLRRFEEEATAVAKLRHPNIVQVFDFNHDGDFYYMVQEFVPGETLQDRLRRMNESDRMIPVEEAIGYTLDICEAAGYAHKRGMIHRDIKPANIMIDIHGKAILMDFGIVKITDSIEHTVAGAVVGTALYMPPELIRGEVPDPRSDLYSLGVTLYEVVSGHPPFEAASAMTLLMMHLQDPVPDVRNVRSDVPPPLSAVLTKMLAKERSDRYSSMADLAHALKDVQGQIQGAKALHGQATVLDEAPAGTPVPGSQQAAGATKLDAPAGRPEKTLAEAAAGEALRAPGSASAVQKMPPQPLPAEPHREGAHAPGASAVPAAPQPPAAPPAPRTLRLGFLRNRWLWVGGLALGLALALGLVLVFAGGNGSDGEPTPAAASLATGSVASATASPAAVEPTDTLFSSPTESPSAVPATTTEPPPPTAVQVEASIAGITLDTEGHYVVAYQTVGLPEVMTTTHLHFFFNTVPFDQAGAPAEGPWIRYFGPSPFSGYSAADRPENASQLCVQAANPNHTPLLGSGGCALLPDVTTVSADRDLACLFGPGEGYPAVATLRAGQSTLVRGLSADELWWDVVNPESLADVCWLSTLDTQVSGDISRLPLLEGPAPDAVPAQSLSVEITGIALDQENHYVVDHAVQGFTPAYPGTHIHFYFNTFSAAEVGIGGEANRRAHGGPSPFSGFSADDRPGGATEMCAIVANPDHSVVPNSGNCYPLPDLPTVTITDIAVDGDQRYVTDFAVEGFVPEYPGGTHIHFYFNIFTPDQVGIGGDANRRSHGGPPPFSGYGVADRPEGATQLCAIVANPDHSVIPGSGNCYTLPGLPTVEITGITVDGEGRYVVDHVTHGFTPEYPGGTHIHFFFDTFSPDQVGIGGDANRRSHGGPPPFTGYAAADRPEGATQLCAIVANPNHSVISNSGNCYHLPDVLEVEITAITIDTQNRYAVEYVAYGFTPKDPGTHVHFYFDTVLPSELGQSGLGHRYSHGGSSPFAGYSPADRPPLATQLCAVVVNPDNSLVPNSGNCFPLPDVQAS
jgi:hypothetical protein